MSNLTQLIAPYLPKIAYWIAVQLGLGVVSAIVGHKTQIEAFVLKHPNWTMGIRVARALGVDPWLVVKALKEWLSARAVLKITTGALVIGVFFGCTPARYPTPQELAIVLANTTDIAVSEYIIATPETAMPVTADFLLEVDERMIELARLGGNVCMVAKDARTVSTAIKCSKCLALTEQLEGFAKCPL